MCHRACGEFFLPYPQATSTATTSIYRKFHPTYVSGRPRTCLNVSDQNIVTRCVSHGHRYETKHEDILDEFKDNPQFVYYGEYIHSFCACCKQVAMLDKCLEHGANINAQDTLGNTALHVVIMLSHRYKCDTSAVMAPILMKRGASIDVQNHDGYTPLLLCAHYGDVDVFNILLQVKNRAF